MVNFRPASTSRGHLYRLLGNPIYLGKISHKRQVFPGQHPAIIDTELWDKVQAMLASNLRFRRNRVTAKDPSLLAGLVYDSQGERLTPTHACKGTRRYRYYVSHRLVGRNRESDPAGLRIPSQELEDAVRHSLYSYLSEPQRLLENVVVAEAGSCQVLIEDARTMADAIERGTTQDRIELFVRLIEQVVVHPDRMEITLTPDAPGAAESPTPIVITLPTQFRRCGLGIRLVVLTPGISRAGAVDPRLAQLVNRGISWFRQMVENEPKRAGAIAKAEGVGASYVIRVTYLAFLAPDIVEAIQRGTHPATLTADRLIRSAPLPMNWEDQRRLLGFAASDILSTGVQSGPPLGVQF